jgi:hypothetical protein
MCAEAPTSIDSQIDVFVAIGPPSKLSLAYREPVIELRGAELAPNDVVLAPVMWLFATGRGKCSGGFVHYR